MHHYLLVSVEATSVIFMDFWVPCKSIWNLKGYVSSNSKHYVHWIITVIFIIYIFRDWYLLLFLCRLLDL